MLIEKKDIDKMLGTALAGQALRNDTALYLTGEMNKPRDVHFFNKNEDKNRIDKLMATGKYSALGVKDLIGVLRTIQKNESVTPELPFRKSESKPVNLMNQLAVKPAIRGTRPSLNLDVDKSHTQSQKETQSNKFRR